MSRQKYLIGSRTVEDRTPFKIAAVPERALASFNFERPATYLVMGNRGTGKSSLIEVLAERHPKIIDLYGSKDNENLCWCRDTSPIDDILLVHGDNTDVESSFNTINVGKLRLSDLEDHEATVTCHAFFSSDKVKYQSLDLITKCLEQRTQWREGDLMFMAFRETMDLIYSKMSQGQGEKDAKASLLYFMRQLRHFGVSVGADMLRWTGLDKEMRDLSEYIIFKKIGWKGLPGDLSFVFNYMDPVYFRYMKHSECVILQENGNIAKGKYDLPRYHKEEGVDLLRELSIKVEHGERLIQSVETKVGDREHREMIDYYKDNGSMMETGQVYNRSSGTVSAHVKYHNMQVRKNGFCDRCKRADGKNIEISVHAKKNHLHA